MGSGNDSYRRRGRSAFRVAALLSLLVHALGLVGAVVYLASERDAEKPEDRELVFLDMPPEPAPEPAPAIEQPRTDPAPAPRPKGMRAEERSRVTEAPPAPLEPSNATTSNEQPLGTPDGLLTEESIATSPTPSPGAIPGLPPGMSPDQVRTNLSWSAFERALGGAAETAREEYAAASMEKRRGGMRFGALTGKVKAALQNQRSWVAEGSPEQLSPREVTVFRSYLESTHDKIHLLFADSFLVSLTSLDPSDPLNNMDLMTKMEFEILANGTINEVHVLRTSGIAVFDAAAVDSLYRASPFIPPPKEILSWNSRAYFRWGFYRNQRKCGVFNAEPYRLRAPDAAPEAIPENTRIFTDG